MVRLFICYIYLGLTLPFFSSAQEFNSPWDIEGNHRRHDLQMVSVSPTIAQGALKNLGFDVRQIGEAPALPIKAEKINVELKFKTRDVDEKSQTRIPAIALIDSENKAVGLITHLYYWVFGEKSHVRLYLPIVGQFNLLTIERQGQARPYYGVPNARTYEDRIVISMSNGGLRVIDTNIYRSFQNTGNYLIDIGTTFGEIVNPDPDTTYSPRERPPVLNTTFSEDGNMIIHMRIQRSSGVFMCYANLQNGKVYEQWLQNGFKDARLSPNNKHLYRLYWSNSGASVRFVNFELRGQDSDQYQTSARIYDIQKIIWTEDLENPWVLRYDPEQENARVMLSRIDPLNPENLKHTYFVGRINEWERAPSVLRYQGDGVFYVDGKIVDTKKD